MYFQLKDVKAMNGVQGKFIVLNQQMDEVGEMIQYDDRVEFIVEGEVVIVDDNLKSAIEDFKKLLENNKEKEAIELYKEGKIVAAIRTYKTYVPNNMHIGQISVYLESKVREG